MKRTLLTAISVILTLVSMFGIYASFAGLDDTNSIVLEKNRQKAAIIQNIDLIEDSVEELDKLAEDRGQDEMDFAEGTAAQAEGGKKLDAGQAEYNAGKAQYDAGKAKYDAGEKEYNAAKALYDQKKQEYDHAVDNLEEARNQLESAKQQRDAGQAKLDAATPAYNALKGMQSSGQDWVGYIADGVARQYGYSSAAAAISEYESGQAQLASANAQIADAEQQIADGEKQLADAKAQLDAGKAQLDAARKELDSAKGQLDSAKGQLDKGKAQLDKGKAQLQEKSDAMEEALENLKQYDDAQSIVDVGIEALLANDAIAERVVDRSDYHEILNVARTFIEEDSENVSAELEVRQQLYSFLRIASIIGLVAGIVCIIAAFKPTLGLLRAAVAVAWVSSAAAVALNVYGFTKDYTGFAYCLEDGSGDGTVQLIAIIALMIFSLLAAVFAVVCLRAYKIGLGIITPRVDEDDFDDYDDEEAVEMGVSPKELGGAARPVEDVKPEVSVKPAAPVQPAELDQTVDLDQTVELVQPAAPEETLAQKERKLKAENNQLKANLENMEYEKARKEYEAARKKYEEARRKAKGGN